MIDKTTEGHTAADAEVEGMLRNLCAYALSDPEPLARYLDLTHQQVVFDGVVMAIRRERGKALAALLASGLPADRVAEMARLSAPSHVKTLVTAAGLTMPRAPRKQSAGKPATRASARTGKSPTSTPTASSAEARSGVPMLPLPPVPAGKRMLTADERRALGLTTPRAGATAVPSRPAAAKQGGDRPAAAKPRSDHATAARQPGGRTQASPTDSRPPGGQQPGVHAGRKTSTQPKGTLPTVEQTPDAGQAPTAGSESAPKRRRRGLLARR